MLDSGIGPRFPNGGLGFVFVWWCSSFGYFWFSNHLVKCDCLILTRIGNATITLRTLTHGNHNILPSEEEPQNIKSHKTLDRKLKWSYQLFLLQQDDWNPRDDKLVLHNKTRIKHRQWVQNESMNQQQNLQPRTDTSRCHRSLNAFYVRKIFAQEIVVVQTHSKCIGSHVQ